MATITLRGTPIDTVGALPAVGTAAPDFCLTGTDLKDVSLADYAGKTVVLNIFPSIDTPTCASSVRKFNELAAAQNTTVVLCISADLPFAHKRFCEVEGLKNVFALSTFRAASFGREYGVTITSGVLTGLLSRAVVIIDKHGKIRYTEQVPEIGQEPNYQQALAQLP